MWLALSSVLFFSPCWLGLILFLEALDGLDFAHSRDAPEAHDFALAAGLRRCGVGFACGVLGHEYLSGKEVGEA